MYLNYKRFSLVFDPEHFSFSVLYSPEADGGEQTVVDQAFITMTTIDGRPLTTDDFAAPRIESGMETDRVWWRITCPDGPASTPEVAVLLSLDSRGARCRFNGRAVFSVRGGLIWGADPGKATFAVREEKSENPVLRASSGPAATAGANALFDRLTDRIFRIFCEGTLRLHFNWAEQRYELGYRSGLDYGRELVFSVREHLMRDRFNLPYAPIRKAHGFAVPPVGWMTWYAVRFGASAEVVLANASELLRRFGAYCGRLVVWVDWEWCHRDWEGHGEPGADIFHPRRDPYPEGLAPVAAALTNMGLIPALWIGATNEGRQNAELEAHPEWLLGRHAMWCGQWWVDPSHPGVVSEYIPKIFRQVLDWGYRMIKWDCLPATLENACRFHDRFADPALSPAAALRQVVQAARRTVGEATYMLSCAGDSERDICCALDSFDAARIGGDIFGWEEFIDQAVGRVLHCYAWHNTAIYCDADNLVLRDEFNNLEQARSRVSFYGLTGLPVTVGDAFAELDDRRTDMLRRIIPPVEAHPAELVRKRRGGRWQLVQLNIARPFGEWVAAAAMNLGGDEAELVIDLAADLDLECGNGRRYAVFDFWNRKFLGEFSTGLVVRAAAFDTVVLRITPLESGVPAVIGSSRHITQGGVELLDFHWDPAAAVVSGTVLCAEGEVEELVLLLPDSFRIREASIPCRSSGRLAVLELTGSIAAPSGWRLELEAGAAVPDA